MIPSKPNMETWDEIPTTVGYDQLLYGRCCSTKLSQTGLGSGVSPMGSSPGWCPGGTAASHRELGTDPCLQKGGILSLEIRDLISP